MCRPRGDARPHVIAGPADTPTAAAAGIHPRLTDRQGLYLDPAARTGYLVDASDTGVERFTYWKTKINFIGISNGPCPPRCPATCLSGTVAGRGR